MTAVLLPALRESKRCVWADQGLPDGQSICQPGALALCQLMRASHIRQWAEDQLGIHRLAAVVVGGVSGNLEHGFGKIGWFESLQHAVGNNSYKRLFRLTRRYLSFGFNHCQRTPRYFQEGDDSIFR